jgi:YVTN family beta-propeller protein
MYVINQNSGNVSVVSGMTHKVIKTLTVQTSPIWSVYDPANDEIYVADELERNVSVISGTNNSIIATIPVGLEPESMVYDPGNGDMYVGNFGSNNVSAISGTTDKVVATIPVGTRPEWLAYDSVTGQIYVANSGSNNVSAISDITQKVVKDIMVGSDPQTLTFDLGNDEIYVPNNVADSVSVIAGSNDTVIATINVGAYPQFATYDPENGDVYVNGQNANSVSVISGVTNSVVATVTVGSHPYYVLYSPADGNLYVDDYQSDAVSVISGATNKVIDTVTVGANPYMPGYDGGTGEVYVPNGGSSNVSVISTIGSPGTSSWANITATAGTSPSGRYASSVAYDPVDRYVVLFGGCIAGSGEVAFNDTWIFRDGAWSKITPAQSPGARCGADMSWDARDGYIVLYGGQNCNPCSLYSDTWKFLGGQWTKLTPSAPPSGRVGAAMTYDASDGYLLLFGGFNYGTRLPDTWSFAGGQWTELYPTGAPPPRNAAFMTYDTADGYVLMFGGYDTSNLGDTWTYHAGLWSELNLSTSPSARSGAENMMVYDPDAGSAILFGGGVFNDTWTFSGGSWANVTGSSSPSPRGTQMAWDAEDGYVLLSGGIGSASSDLNNMLSDTWNYSAPISSGPSVTSFSAGPSTVAEGYETMIETDTIGGVPPLTYAYAGLPTGCFTANMSTLACTPSVSGTFSIQVTVMDSKGLSDSGTATLVVISGPTLASVAVSPSSRTVSSYGLASFTATPSCTGGTCPSGATYQWTLTNGAMGTLNATSRVSVSFTAGSVLGTVGLFVNETLNSITKQSSAAVITITPYSLPSTVAYTLVLWNNSLIQGNFLASGNGLNPNTVIQDPGKGEIFVTLTNSNTVSVISDSSNKIVANVTVGSGVSGMAYDSGKGEVLVANGNSDDVSVIDDSTNAVVATIPEGAGTGGIAYDPAKGELFISNGNSDNVSIVNDTTNHQVATVSVGSGPSNLAYDPSLGEVFVVNYVSFNVSVISDTTDKVVANIPLGIGPNCIAYDSERDEMFVGYYGYGATIGNSVSVISDATNKVVANITVGSQVQFLTYDPANGAVFDANQLSDSISEIADANNSVVSTITVGSNPVGIAYDSSNGYVYVGNHFQGTLSLISAGAAPNSLVSLSVNPGSASVPAGGTASPFAANVTCNDAACPPGVTYSWTLTDGAMGSLNSTTEASASFTAGSEIGTVGLFVNATLNGVTRESSAVITVTEAVLVSVALVPATATVAIGGTQAFAATPVCSTTCPLGTVYTWTLTSSAMGTLNVTTGVSVTFTAGTTLGSVGIIVNATLNSITKMSSPAMVTVTTSIPTLISVAVAPPTDTLPTGGSQPFTALPTCSATCLSGTVYSWTLTDSAMGTLNESSGVSVKFAAGNASGSVGLFVNATLNSITRQGSAEITVTTSVPTLTSVIVSPATDTLASGGNAPFTAVPTCSSACPLGVTYVWSLTKALGNLNSTTAHAVTFTAGSTGGTVGLFVNATLNGATEEGSSEITITTSVPTLTSVYVAPTVAYLATSGIQVFAATPTCSAACPSGISYSWALTRSFGTLNASIGIAVLYTAGNDSGSVNLFVNATLNGKTVRSSPVSITVTPVLTEVQIGPTSGIVQVGKTFSFTATASCSSSPCPSGISYAWTLNNTLGSVFPSTGPSTTFTAGSNSGIVALTVTSTLNGTTMTATALVTITLTAVPVLTGVNLNIQSTTIQVWGSQQFTATPVCAFASCPSTGITYSWSTNNTLGNLSTATGSAVVFTAGNKPGIVTLTVLASFNGQSVTSNAVISISRESGTSSTSSNSETTLIVVVIVVVVIAIMAILLMARKRRPSEASHHLEESPTDDDVITAKPKAGPIESSPPDIAPVHAPSVGSVSSKGSAKEESSPPAPRRFCPKCGTPNDADAILCKGCGSRITSRK